jgi:two-component system KDP operon response regulator KdpE
MRKIDYDAVLMDLNMPGMGGMIACNRIRKEFPEVSILVVTVRDNERDKLRRSTLVPMTTLRSHSASMS